MVEKTISNLKMYPFNTTMMGVLKGVADYFGISISDAWMFGGSGHAFLINIHKELCPSGPYCWKYDTFYRLLRNLGISMKDLGFFNPERPSEERMEIEELLKRNIDSGIPCSLLNMENQLITGYSDTHFIIQKPWPKADLPFTPETLTFQTWSELGDEFHMNLFAFERNERAHDSAVIRESLRYAVDIAENPKRYELSDDPRVYFIGLEAFGSWVKAVESGHGASHGNWWNGTVWGECRKMAAKYFAEIAESHQGRVAEESAELSRQYEKTAELIVKASSKELADAEKTRTLEEARESEEICIDNIKKLLETITH